MITRNLTITLTAIALALSSNTLHPAQRNPFGAMRQRISAIRAKINPQSTPQNIEIGRKDGTSFQSSSKPAVQFVAAKQAVQQLTVLPGQTSSSSQGQPHVTTLSSQGGSPQAHTQTTTQASSRLTENPNTQAGRLQAAVKASAGTLHNDDLAKFSPKDQATLNAMKSDSTLVDKFMKEEGLLKKAPSTPSLSTGEKLNRAAGYATGFVTHPQAFMPTKEPKTTAWGPATLVKPAQENQQTTLSQVKRPIPPQVYKPMTEAPAASMPTPATRVTPPVPTKPLPPLPVLAQDPVNLQKPLPPIPTNIAPSQPGVEGGY